MMSHAWQALAGGVSHGQAAGRLSCCGYDIICQCHELQCMLRGPLSVLCSNAACLASLAGCSRLR